MKKILISSLAFVLILSLFAFASFEYLLRRSVPPVDGIQELFGLTQEVKVFRDEYGIPHIEASNSKDLYRSFGYIYASERLFQMEINRRAGLGQLSEILGEKLIETDKFFKLMSFDKNYDHPDREPLSPEVKEKTLSFIAGINEYIKTAPLPIEFIILNYTPREFELRDIYGFMGLMAFRFSNAPRQDPLFQKLSKALGDDTVRIMSNDLHRNTKLSAINPILNLTPHLENVGIYLPKLEGSNAWAIAPSKSKSGKAILANDPHIGFGLPDIWFEAHLKSPDFEIYGHFLPLIPFAAIGHNKDIAWGLTMSSVDDMDFYEEEINWKEKKVLFKNKWVDLKEKGHKILVKGSEPINYTTYWSPHGPVLGQSAKKGLSKENYSLKWTFHDKANRPLEAFHLMNKAKEMKTMSYAISLATAPGINVLYADNKGNIAWWMFGAFPLRPLGMNGDRVYPGGTGEYEWLGFLPENKKPKLENPKNGYIVSANARPVGADENIKGYWHPNDRFITISKFLGEEDKVSKEFSYQVQTSGLNMKAYRFQNIFIESLKEYKTDNKLELSLIEDLKKWNGDAYGSSRATAVFHVLLEKTMRNLYDEMSEDNYFDYCKLNTSWIGLYRFLKMPNHPLWDFQKTSKIEVRNDIVLKSFKDMISYFKENIGTNPDEWMWGRLHTITFKHPFGLKEGLLAKLFNLGPFEAPGSFNSVNNFRRFGCSEEFQVGSGPSTRIVVDFEDTLSSLGGTPLGVSAHYRSPFFQNQRVDFLEGQSREQIMDWQRLKKIKPLILK